MKRLLFLALAFLVFSASPQSTPPSLQTGNIQVFTGQQTATGTATALASQALKTICIKALHANTSAIYLGNSGVTTGNGMELMADQSYCQAVGNANQFYILQSSGGGVSWIGSN